MSLIVNQWIDVNDELPEHLECVLVWVEFTDDDGEPQETFDFADFHQPSPGNAWFQPYALSNEQGLGVTHWQRMKKPGA